MDDWMPRGACRQVDPELFWPEPGAWSTQAGQAVHTCRTHCPVLTECRRWSRDQNVPGMIGGGEHWVTLHGSGGKRVVPSVRTQASSLGCKLCAVSS